jgi:hypothetical protein
MALTEFLKKIAGRKEDQPKASTPTPKFNHPVEFAFECGGIKYFQFVDKNNMPATRGLEAITFYQELQNGVTNAWLKAWQVEFEKVLSNPKQINVNEIVRLHLLLKDRLNYVISKDVIYNLASVAYFAEDENPETYDYEYNKRKIQHWKKESGNAFFLSQPLRNLIPFLNEYGSFSQTYLNLVEEAEKMMQMSSQLKQYAQELNNESD